MAAAKGVVKNSPPCYNSSELQHLGCWLQENILLMPAPSLGKISDALPMPQPS